ncbi:MAG: ABC transporter permease subunit [Planctomycetota bacterium]
MPNTLPLVIHSIALTLETLAFSLPLGTAVAWMLVRSDLPGRRVGVSIIVVLLFLPIYLQASAWQAGFGQEGWYSHHNGGKPWLSGWNAAVWVHSLAAIPWVVLFASLGLRNVEPALEEQALLDGTPWQVFRRVTLPACWPAFGLAAVWVAMLTAGEKTVTEIFLVRTYAEEVFNQIATHEESSGALIALLPGILGTLVLLGLGMFFCTQLARTQRPLNLRPSRVFALGRWRWPLALGMLAMLMLLAGVPLGNLLYKAGVLVSQTDEGRVRIWSAGKCLETILRAPWQCRQECLGSLVIGSLAATAAVLAAIPLAWLTRKSRWLDLLAIAIALVCLVLPGPLLALAIIGLLNQPSLPWLVWLYDHSLLAPWMALTFRATGPAVLVLWHGVRTIPQPMLDCAATEGCGSLGQLVWIVLPQRLPALGVAWLIGFALALGDLTASILVVPPGVQTLSIHIFNWVHSGVEDQVAGICLALTVTLGVLAAAVTWLASVKRNKLVLPVLGGEYEKL